LAEWSDAPDGRHYYESVKFPLLDAEGRLYATCGVSLDVTDRQRAADALAEARDAAVSATAAKSGSAQCPANRRPLGRRLRRHAVRRRTLTERVLGSDA
jgi:hypothetical protein